MSRIHLRRLPEGSAILTGRGPLDPETGFRSTRLQVWWCDTDASWTDDREHAHRECDECFVVLRGSIVVDVEGEEHVVGPREFCAFPAGVFHRIVRAVPPVEALVIRAPGDDDKVYR